MYVVSSGDEPEATVTSDSAPDVDNTAVQRSMYILAMVNVAIWALSLIALVFVVDDYPGTKGMYPILAGGTAVGILLIATIGRSRQTPGR